jgi:hypothetical protein
MQYKSLQIGRTPEKETKKKCVFYLKFTTKANT